MKASRSRFFWGLVCIIFAAVLLTCGWLMPIHVNAVDSAVIERAGRDAAATGLSHAVVAPPGGGLVGFESEAVTPYLIRPENRHKALEFLSVSTQPAVQELLRCLALTNTVLFPPSASASGQAIDAAVAICGLLVDGGHVTPALRDIILTRASAANRAGDPQPIEEILMDGLSLGQRLDWRHLVNFTERIEDPRTLAVLADTARNAGDQLNVLYSAVQLSKNPAAVAQYLSSFSRTGMHDLATSEQFGAGAVDELLHRGQRLYASPLRQRVAGDPAVEGFFRAVSDYSWHNPHSALALKWFFYLAGGFLLALTVQLVGPGPRDPTEHRATRGLQFARELLFASGVLLVALLLSEPFLAQESQKGDLPFRLRLPSVGSAVASQITHAKRTTMSTNNMSVSLLTLLLFFVLQALIYAACLARLRETLRQNVSSRIKLKLLENEDHLFDAGLYLGFVGTIICLILVSLGVLQFSLMAAYSSTSFGIIFVSFLKIFKVRPARRRLLLQAEEETAAETPGRATAPAYAAAP